MLKHARIHWVSASSADFYGFLNRRRLVAKKVLFSVFLSVTFCEEEKQDNERMFDLIQGKRSVVFFASTRERQSSNPSCRYPPLEFKSFFAKQKRHLAVSFCFGGEGEI